MFTVKLLGTALILVAAVGALSACDQNEGPAEKAGESIDRAVEETTESLEETKDEVKDATD